MKRRLWSFIVALIGVTLLALPISSLKQEYEEQYHYNLKVMAAQEIERMKGAIQADLQISLNYAHFLELICKQNPDLSEEELVTYAEMITTENHFVRTIVFAKKGIIDFIYPFPANPEEYIGRNLFEDPSRKESVLYAYKNRTAVTQGPFDELGTLILYNRQPIFIGDEFYGFVTIGVDLYKMLEEHAISEKKGNLQFAMQALSEVDGEKISVFGNQSIFNPESVIETLEFPGETLVFAAYPEGGWEYGRWEITQRLTPYYVGLLLVMLAIYQFTFTYWEKREMAYYDGLTQTMNKKRFERYLNSQLKLKREQDQNGLLLIDINEFKMVNDTYGHFIGDHVLTTVSERIHQVIRTSDKIGRIGGDEFMVFLKHVESKQALDLVCEKIEYVMRQPIIYQGRDIDARLAIGGIMIEKGKDFEALYQEADQAMYKKKIASKEGIGMND